MKNSGLAFRRIAIVNRGEPAMRLIHAVRELNQEHGWHVQTIALYTDPDRRAMFVREADDRYHLGAASFTDPADQQRKSAYLDYENLKRALIETRADAVWVGWGFVAEHAAFVELCDSLGINFIGPSAAVMHKMGDKIASKRIAEAANVPVTPWSSGPVTSVEEARRVCETLGYPVMVKASAGGGGRGIRRIKTPDELGERFDSARSEALKAFGDDTVFIETMVVGARHIEVQIIADKHGTAWAVGVRDCTVQRRNQKVIEEAPSPALTADEDRKVREAAARLASEAGYYNAGTVECLFDPEARQFYFMEMNTRLQVEHPVTEQTTGLDLVKLQLHVASGGRLEGEPPPCLGHAIEVRLNAEDPDNAFAPAPGKVELFDVPIGPGIRVDSGVTQGDVVPPDFDSMIAKIIAHGRNRGEAMGRLRRALIESAIAIRGGSSNKAFLLELLSHPDVVASEYDIGWLDRLTESGRTPHRPLADIALLRAAIDVYEQELTVDTGQFFAGAARGRPTVKTEVGHTVELTYAGQRYELAVFKLAPGTYRVRVDTRSIEVHIDPIGDFGSFLTVGGTRYRVLAVVDGPTHLIEVEGLPYRISLDEGGMLRAPSPAVVLSIRVEPGQAVQAGDPLLMLEAMKMEMVVSAPFDGRVRSVEVLKSQQVAPGAPLVMVEPEGETATEDTAERVVFRGDPEHAEQSSAHDQCRLLLKDLERLLLGYDVDASEAKQIRSRRSVVCGQLAPDDRELLLEEDRLLRVFADLLPLFRSESGADLVTAEEYLQTYLRAIDNRGERLPASFIDKLSTALSHYGIEDLKRSPQLEEALLFLYKARARLAQSAGVIFDLLERRLQQADVLRPLASPELRSLLERLIEETHSRFVSLNDLARELRYVLYDRPQFAEARATLVARMKERFAELKNEPLADDPAARHQQLAELVEYPQPIVTLLAPSLAERGVGRRLAVEILLRRFYRAHGIDGIRVAADRKNPVVHAPIVDQGRPSHVLASACDFGELASTLADVESMLSSLPANEPALLELYAVTGDSAPDLEAVAQQIQSKLVGLPRTVHRVCVAFVGLTEEAAPRYFTFAQTEVGLTELKALRGIHPMIAQRLELWRLEKFETEPLRISDDIYLFRAVARNNPKDERLVGIVEVRDMTPLLDDQGNVAEVPGLERLYLEALADIRDFQARRESRRRLPWNRVVLLIRPTVELSMGDIQEIARRLEPAGRNLGLEKVQVHLRMHDPETGQEQDKLIEFANRSGTGLEVEVGEPRQEPIEPLSPYAQKVVRLRRLGLAYPYEVIRMMTRPKGGVDTGFPPGDFQEYDLDDQGQLVPVERAPGANQANVVIGVITNYTSKVPGGIKRVICFGDGSRSMGSLAEPECSRINAGIDLAAQMKVPFEWFAVSSGAKISMDVGTEGLDWVARTLRKLVEFTQGGGEVNIIVPGINVGGQSYWNAEGTMLMHTRGILIMTPTAAMVLTGKKALDYSGGVSAEDNVGIGGVERIMGYNGQAQYVAQDIADACRILMRYYDHSYVVPGERWPRRAPTSDPVDRNVCDAPHPPVPGVDFKTIGEIFTPETNPGRKKPFDVRAVMRATIDVDHEPLERWKMMRLAETAVIWDAHLGGMPLTMIGIECRPLTRLGFVPGDGPDVWTGGTLFPRSSKKVARAINAASKSRPVVVLANLSGFDGSPESMREWQLEYGAEIGRAVINFQGPIVFCVISRYHGGAYVVFSCTLNENMQVAAIEGSYASVIGGAPAAAVVFPREVQANTLADPRIKQAQAELSGAPDDVARARARVAYDRLYHEVYTEKQGEMAEYFDSVHSVQRAKDVGSLHAIVPPTQLRTWLIEAVEAGMKREEARLAGGADE
jgi:acetyl/propionyl-CoA carboxylase alpha subunit/acetyl-CoA carboxylase carboxyltransferase component